MIPKEAEVLVDKMDDAAALWQWAHKAQDRAILSGHTLGTHVAILGTNRLMADNASILCIGVGTGDWVRDLPGFCKGADVWAMDVSDEALERVKGAATTVKEAELPEDKFDVAMSFWVTAHMLDAELEAQLKAVVASLKPDGVLALHYLEPEPGLEYDEAQFIATQKSYVWAVTAGLFCRTREAFEKMVKAAGGEIVRRAYERHRPEWKRVERCVHIRRAG